MRKIIFNEKVLDQALKLGKDYIGRGKLADYIPELKKVDPNKIAISVFEGGKYLSVGDYEERFSIQSIIKVILYSLALENYSVDVLKKYVGVKPSAKSFNSVIELELSEKSIPINPFINAGAIVVVALLCDIYKEKTFDVILEKASKFLASDLSYSKEISESEKESSFSNRTLIYLMLSRGILSKDTDVEKVLDTYFKACSIMTNCKELAHMSYCISNGGKNFEGDRIISEKEARVLRSLMATCGTYDYSGDFAIRVGLPAKSGVGGGIVTASKEKYGLAVYSPGLDSHGNSYCGVRMLEYLSEELELYIY